MKIKIIKKIKSKNWLYKKLRYYANWLERVETNIKFECNPFFRGQTLAALNRKEYISTRDMLYLKIEKLEYILENIHNETLDY